MIHSVIVILSLIIVFLIYHTYKFFKMKHLFENVEWCIANDALNKMIDQIYFLQSDYLSIDSKYQITYDERSQLIGILKSFQDDLVKNYFSGLLPNYKYVDNVCFVLNLNTFLEKHQCDRVFNGNEMYTVNDYKTYGTWGTTSFSATYVLTDYAVTYNKLLYVTQIYFLKFHKIAGKNKFGVIQANTTKDVIDNRKLDVNNF